MEQLAGVCQQNTGGFPGGEQTVGTPGLTNQSVHEIKGGEQTI